MSEHDPNDVTTSTPLSPTPTPTPTPTPASVAPVVPVTTQAAPTSGRRRRLRWAAAIAVVALVLGATGVVAALLTAGATQSTVIGYVPDKSIVYGEVRLDLPGDQRKAVGEFLSKFPGFKDQAALETKLDEALDSFVKNVSDGKQTYTTDIKPWFDGQIGFSVGALPPASSLTNDGKLDGKRYLAILSVKDPALAQAWFDGVITKSGAKVTTETYNGATLTVSAETDKQTAAFAIIDGKVAVIGDLDSVKAAVDTKGNSGFASEPGPKAALGAAEGDHVGFVYVATRKLVDWSVDASKAVAPEAGKAAGAALSGPLLKTIPEWTAYWLRFQSNAIVMDAAAPKPETVLGPTKNRTSAVTDHVPASAAVVLVNHELGATLKQMLALYGSDPSLKDVLGQLDKGLDLVGGVDPAIGWIGDTAIVVNVADGTPEAGIVALPTDKEAPKQLLTAIKAFLALGGASQGITVREETYNGTTITVINLGDLAGKAGGDVSGLGMPLPKGDLEIAFASTDDIVVVGSGPGFVKHVLDTTKGSSIASDAQYKALADQAGPGTGSVFVDIATIHGLVEKAAAGMPGGTGDYDKDVKPFLAPFDALYASSSIDGDLTKSIVIVSVK